MEVEMPEMRKSLNMEISTWLNVKISLGWKFNSPVKTVLDAEITEPEATWLKSLQKQKGNLDILPPPTQTGMACPTYAKVLDSNGEPCNLGSTWEEGHSDGGGKGPAPSCYHPKVQACKMERVHKVLGIKDLRFWLLKINLKNLAEF